MTKEEVKSLVDLHKKFDEDIQRVVSKMARYDGDYLDVENWWINGDTVSGKGEVYARGCYLDTVYEDFDTELLSYTDEELDTYVDELIRERTEEEKKKKIEQEKAEKQRDLQKFNELKEKLGL